MSLEKFITAVKTEGMIRTNRFGVSFALPKIFNQYSLPGHEHLQNILLFCESAQLPSLTISTQEVRSWGEYRQIPYEKLFPNINLSFYVDNSMTVKLLFDNWISNIQNPVTKEMNYYDDYITNMTIKVGDVSGNGRYFVTLNECYPTQISAVELSQNGKDVMMLNVSMNYRNWISNSDSSPLDDYTTSPIPQTYFTGFNEFQNRIQSLANNINPNATETFNNIIGVGRELV